MSRAKTSGHGDGQMTDMFRVLAAVLAGALLAGCEAQMPDSGRGLGTTDYSLYEVERARREALLAGAARGTPILPPGQVAGALAEGAAPGPSGISSAELAAAGIGPGLPAAAPVATFPTIAPGSDLTRSAGVQASPANAASPGGSTNSSGISDEQNFDAVASRESIESDAARIAQNRAQYQVVQPTALPERNDRASLNLVQYAIDAPNNRGQEWYSRSILHTRSRFERNCAAYRSPDDAQRDFLFRGGPERDSLGIDPDGDGFACGWDPAPFRAAVGRG